MLQQKLREVLLKELKGKEFVYVTKYGGEVFSKVSDIHVTEVYHMDKESSRKFKIGLSKASQKVQLEEKDKIPVKVDRKWSGSQYKIEIVTSNKNFYKLEEIIFLS